LNPSFAPRTRAVRVVAWFFMVVAVFASLAGVSPRARAEDQVTVRGAYYKETSTRVVQPVVEISKGLPAGFDIKTYYLLDAITSASLAAGTTTDAIFTELRNEAGFGVGKNFERTRITASYRYSAESDYWSHGLAASVSHRFWGDSATASLFGGISLDAVSARTRTPDCIKPGQSSCALNVYFGGLSYTQVLSPTLIAQLSYEIEYWDGFQGSIYRMPPNRDHENVPSQRTRHALTPRIGYYLSRTSTGVQLQYRYYHDDWSITAHMAEGRVYQNLTRDLEVRLAYRHYFQTPAFFWCDWMAHPDCYPPDARLYTADPKLQSVSTKVPEIKLVWEAVGLRGVPVLGWFSTGSFEISYARFFQNTVFGNAHLLQTGYTMPY
jgi:hypothetical protein